MIILDLDDTIFPTKSMDASVFDPILANLKDYYVRNRPDISSDDVISELWSNPIDTVFSRYNTPGEVIADFYNGIAEIDYSILNISPFSDYKMVSELKGKKILVTTGLRELQLGKIDALGIEHDFESIHIDDPRISPRKYKKLIFQQILNECNMAPKEVWVIGDNPESELKAGKQLGMNTIQRMSGFKPFTRYADHVIHSFDELIHIIT